MRLLTKIKIEPSVLFWLALPLALWALLLLSLQAGDIRGVSHPGKGVAYLNSLRSLLPLLAGYLVMLVMTAKLLQSRPEGMRLFGPLGSMLAQARYLCHPLSFMMAYGLVGILSLVWSPKVVDALYWGAAFMSVPLVLWAISWGGRGFANIQRIIAVNWLIVALAVLGLFVVALIYLKLGSVIAHPSDWFECKLRPGHGPMSWYELTSNKLRPTGVGRYAALAGILSVGGLWQRRWSPAWGGLLVISLILLLTSGARSAMVGFAVAAPLVIILHGGRRAAVAGAVAVALLVPVVWGTGVYDLFLDKCVLSGSPEEAQLVDSGVAIEKAKTFDLSLTGRTVVWKEGLERLKGSPALGFGFHGDRLLLGTHMHNAVLHAAFQTGIIGALAFLAAVVAGWVLTIKAIRRLSRLSMLHKYLVIQGAGVLTFFSIRAITESSGAFFGVDWLLLAPFLLYFQLLNSRRDQTEA